MKVEVQHFVGIWYLCHQLRLPRLQNFILVNLEITRVNYKALPVLEHAWEAANGDPSSLLWKWALASWV